MAITVAQVPDLMTKLFAMSEEVDSLKDLLLSTHFKIDRVKDVTKERSVDVGSIRLRLDQTMKEAIEIATKVKSWLQVHLHFSFLHILRYVDFYSQHSDLFSASLLIVAWCLYLY